MKTNASTVRMRSLTSSSTQLSQTYPWTRPSDLSKPRSWPIIDSLRASTKEQVRSWTLLCRRSWRWRWKIALLAAICYQWRICPTSRETFRLSSTRGASSPNAKTYSRRATSWGSHTPCSVIFHQSHTKAARQCFETTRLIFAGYLMNRSKIKTWALRPPTWTKTGSRTCQTYYRAMIQSRPRVTIRRLLPSRLIQRCL